MLSWAVVVASISGIVTVIRHGMTLRFLWRVFDRAGDRKDLEIAGKAISPRWTADTEARRREPSSRQRRVQLRRLPPPKSTTAEDEPDPRPAA